MRAKRAAAVLASILYCPAVFLLLWPAASAAPEQVLILVVGYPLLVALYFLIAGGIFWKKLGLRRVVLWLWMLLAGYFLSWALLPLWRPDVLQSTDALLPLFLLTMIQFPVWLVVWLGLWAVELTRSPEARGRAKWLGKSLLEGLLCTAVALPILLIGLNIKAWISILPPEAYEDQGVHTFTAAEYELIWEQRTRRNHLGKYGHITTYNVAIHRVTYETADGPWQWQDDKSTQDIGRQAVREGEQVERRVLSLVGEEGYITIDAGKTAQSYVDGQKLSCAVTIGGSLAVLAAEGAVWFVLGKRKRAVPDGDGTQIKETRNYERTGQK